MHIFIAAALTYARTSLALFYLSDLRGAVEEVLPTLSQQGVRVFILSEDSDVEGIESLSDKIRHASEQPLSPQLRASVTMKSPALYIYTSGTTGNVTFASNLHWCLQHDGLDLQSRWQ